MPKGYAIESPSPIAIRHARYIYARHGRLKAGAHSRVTHAKSLERRRTARELSMDEHCFRCYIAGALMAGVPELIILVTYIVIDRFTSRRTSANHDGAKS